MKRGASSTFGLWAILCASLCFAVVGAQLVWVKGAEERQQAFVSTLSTKHASGQLHIVEVDAASIAAVGEWPWSRDHYARLVRQLDRAGVRSIVFDIDFSSQSPEDGDAAFADAIADANASIVMPTFSQAASSGDDRRLDALPIPELRENVSLASASVRPDSDSRVRRMVYGTITGGVPRPSISAHIAGVAGSADSTFLIDFGIAPSSIPRHSFQAIERAKFDAGDVAGKDVIVGATAIELGDRYGVPIHGVIPGVTLQAIAAESLMVGAFHELGWLPLLLVAAIGGYLVTHQTSYRALMPIAALFCVIVVSAQAMAFHMLRTVFDVMPALLLLAAATTGQVLRIARQQLRLKTLTDTETGLPNALAFARCGPGEGQLMATAYIKDFDAIQSVIGKDGVPALIERLIERIRPVVTADEMFRADTRILAWRHAGDFASIVAQFETLARTMRKPVEVGGKRIDVGMSFGIAPESNLAGASRAASHAAEAGRLWHAHEDAEALMLEHRVMLMGELDEAVEAAQLTVLYQPKLRLSSGRIESVEALVRWDHPSRGPLRPDQFIPLAEETNRIEPLTLFVLRQTIADLNRLNSMNITLSAAVNISAKLVSSDRFVSATERILQHANVPLDRIILEVTESATMADPERSARNLQRFRDLGVAISMDDYGTGQSTLSYLQLLPLTELKIDRAFVQHAHRERGDALLVHSTIQLAHSLGLRVVAEGVEDEECLEFLAQEGCDYAQGYHIAKPLSYADLLAFLTQAQFEAAA